ncbi:PQQ-binding-like beta-propeller repeat protein [Paracidobacterium acidisoli]|nr:PQQ-binding-like beta-propeller repeat protein [Paracidobacterium acidisoli]MBT9330819.1 PQQ-binding-like beta-propeller repeat protein [Paracidobacterium acidisoli]
MQNILWKASAFSVALTGAVGLFLVHGSGSKASAADAKGSAPYTQWREYGGSPDDAQYSALKQINRSNVTQLKQVWFYPAGRNGFRFGSNPIIIDNVVYVIGLDNSIAALDATTGKQIWIHQTERPQNITNRGLNYWESKDRSERRILFSINNKLTALDARTGETIDSFGDHGLVDLREGLGRDPNSIRQIRSGTPGKIFDDLIILGSATGEEYESPPGDLRAYNVVTGKLAWQFHTVPHPGDIGYDTWPKGAWKYIGGTNTWGEISIDEKRGIAYFPTGSPTYDFYGADRHGADLYSDCLIALDARTGKYLWHFQTTHHDLWDYDLEAGPKLLTVNHDGKKIDVIAEAGKNGFVWVLDRVTGKPIWPVEERPVPKSPMPGEESWPTQPFPTVIPPFARQKFTADEVDPYIADPKERESIRQEILAARNEGLYTPPSTDPTLETPGNNGGANWGSTAIDPSTSTFYVLSKDAPSMLKLEPKPPHFEMRGSPETQGQVIYVQNCALCHTATLQGQPPGVPSLIGIVQKVGADRVKSTVQNGLSPMPAFPDLSDADIGNLIAYLSHPADAHVPPDILTRLEHPPAPRPSLEPGVTTRYWTGYGYMNSSDGLPAIGPPWSTLTAYNLNTGKIKWQIPFGGVTRLEEKGITNTGSYWPRGGVVVTAGGLIFGGSKSDSTFRAYDKDTGKVLWEVKLPAGPEGIPAVYEIAGREYVIISARPDSDKVVSAGGVAPKEEDESAGANTTQETQGYYVFALPE